MHIGTKHTPYKQYVPNIKSTSERCHHNCISVPLWFKQVSIRFLLFMVRKFIVSNHFLRFRTTQHPLPIKINPLASKQCPQTFQSIFRGEGLLFTRILSVFTGARGEIFSDLKSEIIFVFQFDIHVNRVLIVAPFNFRFSFVRSFLNNNVSPVPVLAYRSNSIS